MKIIRLKFGGIFHHDGMNFFLKNSILIIPSCGLVTHVFIEVWSRTQFQFCYTANLSRNIHLCISLYFQKPLQPDMGHNSLANFQIEKKIGRGQFSEVYRARYLLDNTSVALKKVQVSSRKTRDLQCCPGLTSISYEAEQRLEECLLTTALYLQYVAYSMMMTWFEQRAP